MNSAGGMRELLWGLYFFRAYNISFSKTLRFLQTSQYWSREVLQQYQVDELNKLLALAQAKSPFYGEYYREQKRVLRTLSDMATIPFITKDVVRANANTMRVADGSIRCYEHSTSGSTGEPLVVQVSSQGAAFRMAGKYRFSEWWNIKPYDRSILIWARKSTGLPTRNFLEQLKYMVRTQSIYQKLFINVFDLSSSSIRHYYENAIRYKPVYIYGYLSGVIQFAESLIDAGLDPSALKLKLVIVTSEVLHDEAREFLRNAFHCPVANEYGSAEAGLFGFDCPQGRMHVYEEAVLLSSLTDGGLAVTEIHNAGTPLINYVNQDMVTLSDDFCACGRTSRLITQINGRTSDHAMTVSGEKVSQFLFYYAVKELNDIGLTDAIRKYKVIQRGLVLDFFLIKGTHYNDRALAYLSERIKKVLGAEMNIQFHFVHDIEREKSGKLRFFIQESPTHSHPKA